MKQFLFIIGLMAVFIFNGCSNKVEVLLLPEKDGSVGKIIVIQNSKEIILDKPWQRVNTANLDKIELISKESVESDFGSLLDAMPKDVKNYRFYFKFGSSDMVDKSAGKFNEIVKHIKDNGILRIDVIGYTDRAGDDAYNKKLSMFRAKKIVNMLKAKGVDEKIISLEYYGEANPVVQTADGVPRKVNRRVEVTLK